MDDLRSTVFVVMPFGDKRDPVSGVRIDFDAIYEEAFRPAADRAGFDVVRADEEVVGGFVHVAMFERLLLAEVVLADLTLASHNVMYELGVRHATRPRATLSVFASLSQLPFDVHPIRAIPYRLDRFGRLTDDAREELVERLEQRLRGSMTETSSTVRCSSSSAGALDAGRSQADAQRSGRVGSAAEAGARASLVKTGKYPTHYPAVGIHRAECSSRA